MSVRRTIHVSLRSRAQQWGSFSLAAALLALAMTAPALAEGNTATTMSPPSPNAAQSSYQSENSLPENAETSTYNRPGAGLKRIYTSPRRLAHLRGSAQLQSSAD